MGLRQRHRHLAWPDLAPTVRLRAKLPFQLALGPLPANGGRDIEVSLFRQLRLAEDEQVMRPRQLSHQW